MAKQNPITMIVHRKMITTFSFSCNNLISATSLFPILIRMTINNFTNSGTTEKQRIKKLKAAGKDASNNQRANAVVS